MTFQPELFPRLTARERAFHLHPHFQCVYFES